MQGAWGREAGVWQFGGAWRGVVELDISGYEKVGSCEEALKAIVRIGHVGVRSGIQPFTRGVMVCEHFGSWFMGEL